MRQSAAPSVVGEARMLIDGELVSASSGRHFANVDPATGEELGPVAEGSHDDLGRAVAAARRAADTTDWGRDADLRARCLRQLRAGLLDRLDDIRTQMVAESGMPIGLTRFHHLDGVVDDHLAHAADLAAGYAYEQPYPDGVFYARTSHRYVVREPVGVVAAITPWNSPMYVNLAKIAPALAAGNTVVLKPAPDTSWTATAIGRAVAESTDIPPGVFNVVTSSDHTVGEALVTSPDVDLVSFTGSVAVGQRIMTLSAETMKKPVLELGGKSAHVILDDVDLEAVVPAAAAVCRHGGQACAALTRYLVPRRRYDRAVEILEGAFRGLDVGDPFDEATTQGPQISEKQRRRILGYVEAGKAEGARLVVGGGIPDGRERGFYVEPTLFVDVDPGATIAQEEIFGPVLVVIPYDDEDDAVRIANGTRYGLSAAVTSASADRARRLAARLRAGTISINGGAYNGADIPFGGYGVSGLGREGGLQGFEEYLETKTYGVAAS